GHAAPDVRAVHEAPAVGDDLAVVEVRGDHVDVWQVGGQTPGRVGVVRDDHVARLQRFVLAGLLDRFHHVQADEARHAHRTGVGDEVAVRPGEGARVVRGLLHV